MAQARAEAMTELEAKYTAFEVKARSYCTTLTEQGSRKPLDLVPLQDALLELHLAATRLPPVVLQDGETSTRRRERSISHTEWQTVYRSLGGILPFDAYWDTFDPLDTTSTQALCSTLADDLADIWREMEDGLRRLEAHRDLGRESVWWDWRFGFYTHWGAHAAGALRAIHHFLRRDE